MDVSPAQVIRIAGWIIGAYSAPVRTDIVTTRTVKRATTVTQRPSASAMDSETTRVHMSVYTITIDLLGCLSKATAGQAKVVLDRQLRANHLLIHRLVSLVVRQHVWTFSEDGRLSRRLAQKNW